MAAAYAIVGWQWWVDTYCPNHAKEMGITWYSDEEAEGTKDPEGNISHPIFADAEFDYPPGCAYHGCEETLNVRLTAVGHALLMDQEDEED